MSEWQPIETAPKDGSYILLARADRDMMIGFWNKSCWDDGDFHSYVTWPTHWTPLPKFPSEPLGTNPSPAEANSRTL